MLPYRGLYLVIIISLISIILADIQSGYVQQFGSDLHYSTLPQYKIIHHNKRTRRSDLTNSEFSTSAFVTHGNDVTAKLPSTDIKHSTIDSYELINTNDKRVKNRQIKNDDITEPAITPFSNTYIYPIHTYLPHYYCNNLNERPQVILRFLPKQTELTKFSMEPASNGYRSKQQKEILNINLTDRKQDKIQNVVPSRKNFVPTFEEVRVPLLYYTFREMPFFGRNSQLN
ncbi:uncharacterized protein LOC114253989 [Monomorium pharaonis]|uniref:uncharacterized protein LOC114253989 n=1 Tax=Monomorium pharaonis TaxID=307658 RepID=UPI0017476C22|nr:uncharacterized protein LOC114253989 [Monomorium pharaonis]